MHSQKGSQLEEPRRMGFGGVPLKEHIGEYARKLVKTGAKYALDFFAHAHMGTVFRACVLYGSYGVRNIRSEPAVGARICA